MDTFHDGEEEGSNVIPLFGGADDLPLPLRGADDEASDIVFGLSREAVGRLMGHVYGGDVWEAELREKPTNVTVDDADIPPPPPINIFRGRHRPPQV